MPSRRRPTGGDRDERRHRHARDEPGRAQSEHAPSGSQHDNRKQLGVDKEHKTKTMRARRRGTFP